MTDSLKLMAVLAHPDDESLGMGGTVAKYAEEGVETYLVCATRGQRGRFHDNDNRPSDDEVGRVREQELRNACDVLGFTEVQLLDYVDKDLDRADPHEAISQIVSHIRRVKPQVVTTFGPEGGYGHTDHIAISQYSCAACVEAANLSFEPYGGIDIGPPHAVSKLYFMAWDEDKWKAYQEAFKRLIFKVDGHERQASPWPNWSLTTSIDTKKYWPKVWEAIQCHKTQITIYEKLGDLPDEYHQYLWGSQEYYRVFSSVNGGRSRESDLFEGLR